ncbi:MAG TPA: hypothetical protein DDW34_07030 [Clostridium sp.]|nr:hypothetical protein [Clostridium sp.]
MFCSECGKEASGKFCCHCGATLQAPNAINRVDSKEVEKTKHELNGIDLDSLLRDCGYSKTKAVLKLNEATGLSLKECQAALNEPYRKYVDSNSKFKFEKKEAATQNKEYVTEDSWEAEKAAYKAAQAAKRPNNNVQQSNEPRVAKCPACGSTSLSADKKGFGFGKALTSTVIAGPIGLFAGGIGAGKVMVTCLSCGHRFKAGQSK